MSLLNTVTPELRTMLKAVQQVSSADPCSSSRGPGTGPGTAMDPAITAWCRPGLEVPRVLVSIQIFNINFKCMLSLEHSGT